MHRNTSFAVASGFGPRGDLSTARIRMALVGIVTATSLATTVAAQAPSGSRLGLLVGVGTGSSPDLTRRRIDQRAAALLGALGVRGRPASHLVLDATVHGIATVATGDDALVLPIYTPGVTYRQRASVRSGADPATTADVRAGVEGEPIAALGALVRASAGGGYMWGIGRPYAVVALGIGSDGNRARVTLDLEHRVFQLPIEEFTVTAAAPWMPIVTRTTRDATHATFVRLGLEVPLVR